MILKAIFINKTLSFYIKLLLRKNKKNKIKL